jgi:hypothetical protein
MQFIIVKKQLRIYRAYITIYKRKSSDLSFL